MADNEVQPETAADSISRAMDYLSFRDMKMIETKIGGPLTSVSNSNMVDMMKWVYYCLSKRVDPTATEDQAEDASLVDLRELVDRLTAGKGR